MRTQTNPMIEVYLGHVWSKIRLLQYSLKFSRRGLGCDFRTVKPDYTVSWSRITRKEDWRCFDKFSGPAFEYVGVDFEGSPNIETSLFDSIFVVSVQTQVRLQSYKRLQLYKGVQKRFADNDPSIRSRKAYICGHGCPGLRSPILRSMSPSPDKWANAKYSLEVIHSCCPGLVYTVQLFNVNVIITSPCRVVGPFLPKLYSQILMMKWGHSLHSSLLTSGGSA